MAFGMKPSFKKENITRQWTWRRCLADDGEEYVRFAAENWGRWMGESLEIVNNCQEVAELELAFKEALEQKRPATPAASL